MNGRLRLKELFWQSAPAEDAEKTELAPTLFSDPALFNDTASLRDTEPSGRTATLGDSAPRSGPATLSSAALQSDAAKVRIVAALAVLRDVRGVLGSLVVDVQGAVLGSDLPLSFTEDVVLRLGRRISAVREVLRLERGHFETCVLASSAYQLHIYDHPVGAIGVVITAGTTAPGFEVALKLVANRIGAATSNLEVM